MSELPMTVTDAAAMLRAGDVSSVELTAGFLARADALDPKLGTYVTRLDETALAAAEQADTDFAAGIDKGPYQGIPIGIKDILATADGPTTANSLVLDRAWGAGKDGPVVQRLKAAGAVITGKVTTSEFAIGSPDPTKPFAIPRNPWNLDCTPGGSSAGTGNGIGGGLFLAGIGTDTGGSIRIPAAFNGTSGMIATFGRVPKSGCAPLGYSLDHIGPLARSARDCADMLQIIAGYHPSDETCVDRPVDDYVTGLTGDLTGVCIGVARTHFFPAHADPALAGAYDAAVAALTDCGAEVIEVELPYCDEMSATLAVMMFAEGFAYHHGDMGSRWTDYYAQGRMNLARGALALGADYVQAARVRRLAQQRLAELFETVDLIVSPTAAIGAPTEEMWSQPDLPSWIFSLIFTGYWDSSGHPALAVPMGFTAAGMPLSLQIAARPFEEGLALRAGDAYQHVTDWHLQLPALLTETLAAA